MDINTNTKPAIARAPFGMPACGHAFGQLIGATTSVVRDRVAELEGFTGLATPAHVPATTAWSPPVS